MDEAPCRDVPFTPPPASFTLAWTGLFAVTGIPASIHLYCSAAGTRVLPPHTDPYDVLVWQLEGVKSWRACVPRQEIATRIPGAASLGSDGSDGSDGLATTDAQRCLLQVGACVSARYISTCIYMSAFVTFSLQRCRCHMRDTCTWHIHSYACIHMHIHARTCTYMAHTSGTPPSSCSAALAPHSHAHALAHAATQELARDNVQGCTQYTVDDTASLVCEDFTMAPGDVRCIPYARTHAHAH